MQDYDASYGRGAPPRPSRAFHDFEYGGAGRYRLAIPPWWGDHRDPRYLGFIRAAAYNRYAREPSLDDVEVIGQAVTELRQHTTRVDEVERHDPAAELRQRHACACLIGEREIGHHPADAKFL